MAVQPNRDVKDDGGGAHREMAARDARKQYYEGNGTGREERALGARRGRGGGRPLV